MSLRKYANKRDQSEAAIVEVLRKAGCSVMRMDKPVDLLVKYRGAIFLVECKSGKKPKYTKSQIELIEDKWPIYVICGADDAIKVLTIWSLALKGNQARAA